MALFGFSSSQLTSAATRGLSSSSAAFNKIFAQLASGKRINSASDDAAGVAIASQLEASIKSISQSSRNVSDASSALSIADGALEQIQSISGRLEELAMTSANGVYTDQQRTAIQAEYSALTQEIQRIGATTSYNGRSLLDGSSISVQVSQNNSLSVGGIDVQSLASSLSSQNLSSQASAQSALSAIQDFSFRIDQQRGGSLGSSLSRLESIQEGLGDQKVAQSKALAQIADADIGAVSLDASRTRVLQQYQTALLGKADQLQSAAIKTLLA